MLRLMSEANVDVGAPATDQDTALQHHFLTVEDLLGAVFQLAATYGRHGETGEDLPAIVEATALVEAGAAASTLMACAFACLARTSIWGPALAVGPWAGSALVA